jgi:hypothetical protein
MRIAQLALALAASAVLGFVLANCGGDNGSGHDGSMSNLYCSTGASPCSQAQLDAYGQCVSDKCDAQVRLCYGDNYKNGSYGNLCGGYIACAIRCACTDTACRTMCFQLASAECRTCLQDIGSCAQSKGCMINCSGGSDASAPAGGTCADLQACCGQIADANVKMACMAQVTAGASAGAQFCSNVLMGLRASNMCH